MEFVSKSQNSIFDDWNENIFSEISSEKDIDFTYKKQKKHIKDKQSKISSKDSKNKENLEYREEELIR